MELTVTNRSRAYPGGLGVLEMKWCWTMCSFEGMGISVGYPGLVNDPR